MHILDYIIINFFNKIIYLYNFFLINFFYFEENFNYKIIFRIYIKMTKINKLQ